MSGDESCWHSTCHGQGHQMSACSHPNTSLPYIYVYIYLWWLLLSDKVRPPASHPRINVSRTLPWWHVKQWRGVEVEYIYLCHLHVVWVNCHKVMNKQSSCLARVLSLSSNTFIQTYADLSVTSERLLTKVSLEWSWTLRCNSHTVSFIRTLWREQKDIYV